jgi:hypothetical protein
VWLGVRLLRLLRTPVIRPGCTTSYRVGSLSQGAFSSGKIIHPANMLCGSGNRNVATRYAEVAARLHAEANPQPPVHLIDGFRKISSVAGDPLSGAGLIGALRNLHAPVYQNYLESRNTFTKRFSIDARVPTSRGQTALSPGEVHFSQKRSFNDLRRLVDNFARVPVTCRFDSTLHDVHSGSHKILATHTARHTKKRCPLEPMRSSGRHGLTGRLSWREGLAF